MNTNLPRLIRAIQRQAILSASEARSAVTAHRQNDGRYGGSEAVVHYGGATRVIKDAIRNREHARRFACESPVIKVSPEAQLEGDKAWLAMLEKIEVTRYLRDDGDDELNRDGRI